MPLLLICLLSLASAFGQVWPALPCAPTTSHPCIYMIEDSAAGTRTIRPVTAISSNITVGISPVDGTVFITANGLTASSITDTAWVQALPVPGGDTWCVAGGKPLAIHSTIDDGPAIRTTDDLLSTRGGRYTVATGQNGCAGYLVTMLDAVTSPSTRSNVFALIGN